MGVLEDPICARWGVDKKASCLPIDNDGTQGSFANAQLNMGYNSHRLKN